MKSRWPPCRGPWHWPPSPSRAWPSDCEGTPVSPPQNRSPTLESLGFQPRSASGLPLKQRPCRRCAPPRRERQVRLGQRIYMPLYRAGESTQRQPPWPRCKRPQSINHRDLAQSLLRATVGLHDDAVEVDPGRDHAAVDPGAVPLHGEQSAAAAAVTKLGDSPPG